MEETDFHEQAEDRFIAEVGARLNELSRSTSDNGGMIVIAAPRTLGKLRQNYQNSLGGKLIAEIPKNLTGHPVTEIRSEETTSALKSQMRSSSDVSCLKNKK